jgi:hypothetical protein
MIMGRSPQVEEPSAFEELRSSHLSSLMTFEILLPRVEELRSSHLSSLMTFEILLPEVEEHSVLLLPRVYDHSAF